MHRQTRETRTHPIATPNPTLGRLVNPVIAVMPAKMAIIQLSMRAIDAAESNPRSPIPRRNQLRHLLRRESAAESTGGIVGITVDKLDEIAVTSQLSASVGLL